MKKTTRHSVPSSSISISKVRRAIFFKPYLVLGGGKGGRGGEEEEQGTPSFSLYQTSLLSLAFIFTLALSFCAPCLETTTSSSPSAVSLHRHRSIDLDIELLRAVVRLYRYTSVWRYRYRYIHTTYSTVYVANTTAFVFLSVPFFF